MQETSLRVALILPSDLPPNNVAWRRWTPIDGAISDLSAAVRTLCDLPIHTGLRGPGATIGRLEQKRFREATAPHPLDDPPRPATVC